MRIRIFPYKAGSNSALALSRSLGVKRLRHEGSRFIPKVNDVIINWGSSVLPSWSRGKVVNSCEKVAIAVNKKLTFSRLSECGVSTPDYTDSQEKAQQWVNEGYRVYGRQVLTGNSGQGIVIFNSGDNVTYCPLYTKNTKAKYEYRVHVMAGTVIDVQVKRKRSGVDEDVAVVGIRNLANGWVFCRENLILPEEVKQAALQAVLALGLDFGAVDIGYVERDNKAYVYEVNTACGLEGTTLERYTQGFKTLFLQEGASNV